MRKIKNIVSGNEISVEEVFKRGWQYKLIEEILEAGYESEKRIEALEKKEPKQDEPEIVYGSTVSVRDQKIKKLMEKETKEQRDDWKFSWITDKEMKDKAIRELFDEVLDDVREIIIESLPEGADEVMVKLTLNALNESFGEVREKLNKILSGEVG